MQKKQLDDTNISDRKLKIKKAIDKYIENRLYTAGIMEKQLWSLIEEYKQIPDLPKFKRKRDDMDDEIESRKRSYTAYCA